MSVCIDSNLESATAQKRWRRFFLMKKVLATTLFMLVMFAVAAAQQPGSGQSPSSPMPGANQRPMPGAADQSPAPGDAQQGAQQGPAANVPVTEGCLGGSDPNYTITNTAGTTYKLNIPPSADTSKLAPH